MYHRRSGISPCPEDGSDYCHLKHAFKLFLPFFKLGQSGFAQAETECITAGREFHPALKMRAIIVI